MKKKLAALLALCLTLTLTVLPAAALEAEDAKQLLAQYYVDGVPEDVMELDSLEEILEALDDPYTTYMSAEEYQKFLSAVNGETVVGIGVSVQNAFDNGFRIMSILPDSPALEAGLEAGDRIIAVDGQTLTESELNEEQQEWLWKYETFNYCGMIDLFDEARPFFCPPQDREQNG